MKLILDIKDTKAPFVMELLSNLSYVKATAISNEKAEILEDLKLAVDNLNKVKSGKLNSKSARDLYNEL